MRKKKDYKKYKLYYKYNGGLVGFQNKNFINPELEYSYNKMVKALKTSIKRRYSMKIEDYLFNEFNINIKKCGFCDEYSWFNMVFKFEKMDSDDNFLLIVDNITYNDILINNIKYDKLYCKTNKNCKGKKLNANSVQFVMGVYGLTDTEALQYIKDRNKTPFYKENYKNDEEYKKYQSLNHRLGESAYNNYIHNLKYSKTKQYYIDIYGKDIGLLKWNGVCKSKDSMSLVFFLNKNSGDYNKAIVEYNKRIKSVCAFFNGTSSYSKESYDLFTEIIKKLPITNYMFGETEFLIQYFDKKTDKNRKFYYDFIDLNNKIIIEYNGLRWHPNKEQMTKESYDKWYHPFNSDIKRSDLEEKDIFKKKVAINNGYTFIEVWDNKTLKENIQIITNFYKNNKIIK